jgi:hypothetical protein
MNPRGPLILRVHGISFSQVTVYFSYSKPTSILLSAGRLSHVSINFIRVVILGK